MTSPEWSITGTLYTAMLLKPLWMTVVSVLTGRKYEKLWWDWEELILELKSTILSTTAWIQISRSIIVNWWNNGRKTTTASKTSLKKLKVRKTLSTANVDESEGYKSVGVLTALILMYHRSGDSLSSCFSITFYNEPNFPVALDVTRIFRNEITKSFLLAY